MQSGNSFLPLQCTNVIIHYNNMIAIENLEFSYSNHRIFSNVSMNLRRGAIYGLLGPNGVGKTTLLKIISSLIPDYKGTCLVNGLNGAERSPEFLSNIFYLHESPVVLNEVVEEFVKSNGAFYPNFSIDDFYHLAKVFEIDPKQKFYKMSTGQQKKAFISYALSLHTDVLLMDEPTNGLDIPSKTQFRKVMSEFFYENSTIIISTHQVRDLENLIDPIIILEENGVLLNASLEEISQKLEFSLQSQASSEALYCEPTLGGYVQVQLNTSDRETNVNIEALYNTVISNKELIKSIFNK